MNALRQAITLSVLAVGGIPRRAATSIVTVAGVVTLVAVLTSLLSVGEGVRMWGARDARADRAVVLSRGAPSAPLSQLSREVVDRLFAAPGVRNGSDGKAFGVASTMAFVDVVRKDNSRGNIFLVGMTEGANRVYPEVRLVRGRWYGAGLHEVIVSNSLERLYMGLSPGDRVSLRGVDWQVVGVFADTGGVFDSVMFADGDTVLSAFGRRNFQQVGLVLSSALDFQQVKHRLESDPSLGVSVSTDAESRAAPLKQTRDLLDFLAYFVGSLMAAGAVCAALSSLYASAETRKREIATLQALGFGPAPIVVSILVEGLVLALPAGALGAFVAALFFNGNIVSTSGLTFPLAVTAQVALIGIFWAAAVGLVGALIPALHAVRKPIATGLRDD